MLSDTVTLVMVRMLEDPSTSWDVMEILEVGNIFLKLLEFSFLNQDRAADLSEVQVSSNIRDSSTLFSPVMFTCQPGAILKIRLASYIISSMV
jgi:hypothetical protein